MTRGRQRTLVKPSRTRRNRQRRAEENFNDSESRLWNINGLEVAESEQPKAVCMEKWCTVRSRGIQWQPGRIEIIIDPGEQGNEHYRQEFALPSHLEIFLLRVNV